MARGASRWRVQNRSRAPRGFGVGSSLGEVEDANERPFKISGFGWDYGGYAKFGGGKLDDATGGCTVSVRFNPDRKAIPSAVDRVSGEEDVATTSALLAKTRPYVSQITLDFPE